MQRPACAALLLALCLSLFGCAAQPNAKRDPHDPFERVNRATFHFNEVADRTVAKPVARLYRKVTPRVVRTGVSNFLDNLSYPVTIVNDVLQAKFTAAGRDTARLLINSTVGIAGVFDFASSDGLEKNDEDFGQTLGRWGVKPGPYIVIPLLGPSDVRDGLGRIADVYADPRHYMQNAWLSWGLWGLAVVDLRSRLLDVDKAFGGVYDRYAFIRNAYLQRRQYQVTDGRITNEQQDKEQYQDEKKIIEESEGAAEPQDGGAAPAPIDQAKPPPNGTHAAPDETPPTPDKRPPPAPDEPPPSKAPNQSSII
jgi:phospholipid-binding lipoprotein MlaA